MEGQAKNKVAQEAALKLMEEAEQKRAALRFERGLLEYENGSLNILNNREFLDQFGLYLYEMYVGGEVEKTQLKIDALFAALPEGVCEEEIQFVLGEIHARCLKGSNIRLMQYLASRYSQLFGEGNNKNLVNEDICSFLATVAGYFVRSSLWKNFEDLLDLLWKIRNITFSQRGTVSAPYKNIFSKIGSKDLVEKLLQLHKTGDEWKKDLSCRALSYFGEDAVIYLLNRLVFSNSKEERFLLIDLISRLGEEVIRVIDKFIQEDLPWYAIRNLVLLISELGNADHYPMIEGYLVHPDERVQEQVVACIIKLHGEDLPARLIQALEVVNDLVKLKLVMQLSRYSDEVIANGLIEILVNRDSLSDDIREDLSFRICVTLRSYPYGRVTSVLREIMQTCMQDQPVNHRFVIAIQDTINILEPCVRHREKDINSDIEGMSFDFDPEKERAAVKNVDAFFQEINEMVQAGELEKSTSLMYKKTVGCARAKDFQTAEMLRDKLLEINPDALQDVIRLAEIIEEEKELPTASIESDIWEDFFEQLTPEEYKSIMLCFRNENYREEEVITNIGEINPCLYFFNSGSARLSCKSGRHETFLKRVNPGDIVGAGTFFSASVWTVNLIALQRTQVQVLHRNEYKEHCKQHAELEGKLQKFIMAKENVRDLIRMSGRERRDFARYGINIMVNNILLDPYGGSAGRKVFKGEMLDFSRGGLSFAIRISNRESANLLLGRQIVSEIVLKDNQHLKCFGTIVSVRFKYEIVKEFSIHVKFHKELEQSIVTEVLNVVI